MGVRIVKAEINLIIYILSKNMFYLSQILLHKRKTLE